MEHLGTFEAMAFRTKERRDRIKRENRLFYTVATVAIFGLLFYGTSLIR